MESAGYRVEISGNALAPVIAGNYNVVVDAKHGSSVNVLLERERPVPVRRASVRLLPRQARELLGRAAESAELAEAIRAGGVVQVCGAPGVGKSTILRHMARNLDPAPDGVLFVSAAGREVEDLAQEIFEACYDAAGYAPSTVELRRLMTGVRVTIYVDDADMPAERLRDLTDAAPDATFVLAGTDRSLLADGGVLRIQGLNSGEGLRLLARELGRPLLDGERAVAMDLWKVADGSPLLLLRAAALAKPGQPGQPALPRPGAISELLPLVLDQLDAAETSALSLLAMLGDAELYPAHIGSIAEVRDPDALCERLVDLGLALPAEHGYRCAPDAVPTLRQRNPEPFPVEQVCRYFLDWMARPATTPAQVAQQGRALEQAAHLAEAAGRLELAVDVARVASPAMARSLRFGAWGRLLGRGLTAAERAGDAKSTAYFKNEEGVRRMLIGRRVAAAAILAEAVVLERQLAGAHEVPAVSEAPPGDSGISAVDQAGLPADPTAVVDPVTPTYNAVVPEDPTAVTHHVAVTGDPSTATQSFASHSPVSHSPVSHSTVSSVPVDPTSVSTSVSQVAAGTASGAHGVAAVGAAGAAAAFTKLLIFIAVAVGLVAGKDEIAAIVKDVIDEIDPPTGIVGTWKDSRGGEMKITEAGTGGYSSVGLNACGKPVAVRLTGTDHRVSGRLPIYDVNSSACKILAYGTVTITVSTDGTSASGELKMSAGTTDSSGDRLECYTCGSFTMTRKR